MPYRPRNSRYYYASFQDARGKRVRRSTGTADYAEASALEGQWRADVWRQRNWGESPRYQFSELIEAYVDATASKASTERDLYAAKALAPWFATAVVADITAQDIAQYKRERLQQVSVATVIKELGLFSAAINYANAEWDWGLPNVVSGRIPRQPAGRTRWLTRDESARLLAAAARPRSPEYLPDMIRLALHTGMRHRELLNLAWSRIDLGQRLIYFGPADHKSGVSGSIPINESAAHVLKRRRAAWRPTYSTRSGQITPTDPDRVFTFRGKAIASAKKSFARAAANADIDDCVIHDLRHTFASRLVQASVPIATVKEVMRHRSIQTTMRYAHLAPENSRDAVAAIDSYDRIQTHHSHNLAESA